MGGGVNHLSIVLLPESVIKLDSLLKKMKKGIHIVIVIIGMISLVSCQTEKHEILTEDDQQSFTEGSEFYSLVERASMHDGSQDDDLDESPCFSINFPYRIVINGSSVKVGSSSDLDVILGKINQGFSFEFPLTLTWSNYEAVSVSNQRELVELQQVCNNDERWDNSPITCAEIDFPIKLFVYNTGSQNTNTVNISSRKQLYVFLQNKKPFEVLSLDYPINIRVAGGGVVTVNNNQEFVTTLSTCNN